MTDPTVRAEVIERDHGECQFGKMFGIEELTGVPCIPELEVHHKTYARYGHERPDDLVTVCRRCHDIITSYVRSLRYAGRTYQTEDVQSREPRVDIRKMNGNGKPEFQDIASKPAVDAQRIIGGPSEPIRKRDGKDLWEEEEGRVRSRRTG